QPPITLSNGIEVDWHTRELVEFSVLAEIAACTGDALKTPVLFVSVATFFCCSFPFHFSLCHVCPLSQCERSINGGKPKCRNATCFGCS
ncbi:hypothetical protein BaRGS_00039945, partial [Batillaria attramentaria]